MAGKTMTEAQREEWQARRSQQENEMKELVRELAVSWQENPETIAEAVSFGSRMYNYSVRNNMLIYQQNPNAVYVQSFQAWKEMGAAVKSGEKGSKIWVPVEATILKIDGKLVPLEHATKEQRIQYQAGEIESTTARRFRIGTVFDIAQTTYPIEKYPALFHMGYESAVHGSIVQGLINYAAESLQCQVAVTDMRSISLRGDYQPGENRIRLSDRLQDTQKLSTLAHELGHAVQHREDLGKSPAQKELEADALGIMIESYFGIQPTESRKRHLAQNYRAYEKEWRAKEGMDSFGDVLSNVFQAFRRELPDIMQHVEKTLPEAVMNKQVVQRQAEPREDIYSRIKREISILDYAPMHGIQLQRVGRYYTMQGHDSVRIDPDRNCFWRNSGIGQTTEGSVIDFATAFVHGEDLHAALSELTALTGAATPGIREERAAQQSVSVKGRQERKSLQEALPSRARNMHRAYAYLTQTRYIDQDIVQDFVNRKMLYQDVRGNCVFVAYDEKKEPVFANFRGTLSEVKFLGDVPGSNYQKGFYINNGAKKLVVTESVIDAMSVMTILHGQGIDYKEYDYLPLSGAAKHTPLMEHLKADPKEEVLLALDHDLTGVKDMKVLHDRLIGDLGMEEGQVTYHVPAGKDWNQDLAEKAGKFRPMNEIPFLEGGELPAIHYCAVQSTQHCEERGFRKRNGKDQFRLAELTEDGKILPMDIKRNVIFRSPEELKDLVPSMYEEIPYRELLKKQEELQKQAVVSSMDPETQEEIQKTQEAAWEVRGYRVTEGLIAAQVIHNGLESEENVWVEEGRTYVAAGYMADRTYEEHDLTEAERDALATFMEENGLEAEKGSPLLAVKETPKGIGGKKAGTDLLDQLQQQFQEKGSPAPEPGMSLGIGG